jgi:hypothetical protein
MLFDDDAFISYAHLDNVELVEGRKGWVANLHRALEVRVGQLLGKPPHIWRDPKLSGNDLFADTLIERLKRVAILVTVVSPRYLKSEWTLRELTEFWHAAEQHGGIQVRNKARVFKVLKTPVPLERTPAELRTLIGYEFFRTDPETGKIRELDEVFGPDAQRDFWIRLDDLAHDICELLEVLEASDEPDIAPAVTMPPVAAASPAPWQAIAADAAAARGSAVYLAETTSDLKEQRETLRRDLVQHGHPVLPDQMLPLVAEEAEAAIRKDLARCRMSIHLIGRKYGLVPEGGRRSVVEIQHELATERAQHGGLSRLLWIPQSLTTDDERQTDFLARVRMDPRITGGADLLETFFEDLRGTVQEWLDRDRAPAPSAPLRTGSVVHPHAARRVYLIADQRDADSITPWADGLFEQDLEPLHPIFEGDEAEIRQDHEENLSTCDGVLIFYGAGNELWVRRKLREVQKAAGYGRTKPPAAVGICLIGPRTTAKERFRTHDALVIQQWDGFGPEALTPFIADVKAGGPV